jgi:hypothetical protein
MVKRQQVAKRSNRSSDDDERVPDGTDPSCRPRDKPNAAYPD